METILLILLLVVVLVIVRLALRSGLDVALEEVAEASAYDAKLYGRKAKARYARKIGKLDEKLTKEVMKDLASAEAKLAMIGKPFEERE